MSHSSFSIRRLISPRRLHTVGVDVDERRHSDDSAMSEDLYNIDTQSKQQKSKSWAPSRRQSNDNARRPSREDALARRTKSIRRIPSNAFFLAEGSPQSSSGSLSGHEGSTHTASSYEENDALCSSRSQPRASRSTAPKRLADRRHLCISPLQIKQHMVPASFSSPGIKTFEAGHVDSSEHPAFTTTTITPPTTAEDDGLEKWSLNVQDLIRETDEAFKAVGTAIEEAKTAVASFPPSSDTRPMTVFQSPKISKMDEPHSANRTPPLPPPTRHVSSFSTSRPRRKKSKKTQYKSRSKKSARWQLGEDVAGILSGQFFRKMEVNELLSPEYIQAMRAGRESQLQSRISSDTTRTASTEGSETPVEPFHLQDLPSRIGAAGVGAAVAPNGMVSHPKTLEPAMQRGFTVKEKSPRRKMPVSKANTEIEENMDADADDDDDDEIKPPPPPAKNPLRFSARPQAKLLPPIPEVVITTPYTAPYTSSRKNQTTRTVTPADEDEFLFLQSTPYTLNHPSIRHGKIRFPKTDVAQGMKIDPDETLDWTAFQMAILGAGDLFSDPSNLPQLLEADEISGLTEWFEDFGFDNPGLLIASSSATASPASVASGYSPMSSVASDIDLPIPVEFEYPHGFWNEGNLDASKFLTTGCNIRRWTMESHPKRYNRGSFESLPPSPMMELVTIRAANGESEVVPMGYNLGHDLGDFLRWEAENVYATGVY
ncbi:uncharacterized protein CTRU02_209801 [Colletotrichum truncatum]|uniref:Uncharacterized protein n=1 Tax=Colletotrichum truncatum TaxID=5467 RepID=A0ACC3YTD5_COLTU|nr:uncharacterized protein CTRU02_02373 [Colletotrichum truncatum]KAF6798399.1 hypothetical protein CTRU02_02373 [Colletotrichum truncatum]